MGATANFNDDRDFALMLHGVLSEIDTARWRDEKAAQLARKLETLQRWLERDGKHLELALSIRQGLSSLQTSESPVRDRWLAFKKQLQPGYQALAQRLRERRIHVPSVRPTNYGRSLFHVVSALAAVVMIEWIAAPKTLLAIAAAWAGFAWTCEVARRIWPQVNVILMKAMGAIAHAHEAVKVNSATWYATALVLLALTQSLPLCMVGVAVLGFADPAAALVGRRFGRIRLVHGRSLEGTLTFAVVGTAVAASAFFAFHAHLGASVIWAMSLSAGIWGALAELFSLRWDDNLTVPLASAAGAFAAALVFGVTL